MRSQWEELIEPVWEKRHASAIKETERLKELEEKSTSGPLSSQEAWDRAELTVSLHGDEEALPLFREILASNPDDAHANYALGRILLQRGDAEGVGYMEKAMGKGPEFVESGYCLLEEYMRQGCSEEDAGEILERAERNLDIMSLAMRERVAVSSSDELVSPEISPAVIEDLEEQLKGFHEVLEAFFVRKVITYFPDRPFYLLAVTPFRPWYKLEDSNADSVLQEKLQSTLIFHKDMEDTIVIILRRKKSGLKKKLERITPSVRIYRKR
jgi:tetratricopeptide (TPR) repeat protein